ncbi:MAG TPA: type 4a pilus biogenesis protein PilO [Bryobacteraceae bacterium]|nr:type 4a pilus biogenesis protein PilO [Bryobacteraceae bacterium]
MPKNSSGVGQPVSPAAMARNPKTVARLVVGALLAANLVAAALVVFPPGGSVDELQRQATTLQAQISANQALLERTRQHLAAVEKGRDSGDEFLSGYFLSSRTAYSTLLSELSEAGSRSKIKQREYAYSTEPIEGSDNLSMLTITANFDGEYRDVLNFVHELDRSPRLLIIESLSAAPQQGSKTLSVSMKIDAFVREQSTLPAAAPAESKTVAESRSPAE